MDLPYLLPWVLGTAALSAVFGMAGGMVLLLVLTQRMPLAEAMVLHGALQLIANGSRAVLSARHIRLDIVGRFGVAAVLAAVACAALVFSSPAFRSVAVDVRFVLIATGLIACAEPLLGLLERRTGATHIHVPAADTRVGAFAAGATVTALHLTSGATGPLLDVFFVNSTLDRHANVATKAAVQSIGHSLKIAYFALLSGLGLAGEAASSPSASAVPAFIVLALASVAGTWLGRAVLDRLSDVSFRRGTRFIVCAIGLVSLARGVFA
jgi:uncharacterized membrane protein YfcA